MAGPDRSLRRMVADLAAMTPDDVEAILGALEDDQRDRVESLLAEYRGTRAAEPQTGDLGLSPWLAGRLAQATGGDLAAVGLTAAVRDLLIQYTDELPRLQPEYQSAPPSAWLGRLLGLAARRSRS